MAGRKGQLFRVPTQQAGFFGIEVLTKSKNKAADEIVILISIFKNRALR